MIALLQADVPAPWQGGWVLYTLIVIAVIAVLAYVAVGPRRSRPAATDAAPAPPPPSPPSPPAGPERDIAVMTFPHLDGAERAYADALQANRGAAWLREVAFVEHHRHNHVLMRGTFAGRYLDVDAEGEAVPMADEINASVPEGSSALVIFAPPDDVSALADALASAHGRLARHHLSAATVGAIEASVADAPPAAPPPA